MKPAHLRIPSISLESGCKVQKLDAHGAVLVLDDAPTMPSLDRGAEASVIYLTEAGLALASGVVQSLWGGYVFVSFRSKPRTYRQRASRRIACQLPARVRFADGGGWRSLWQSGVVMDLGAGGARVASRPRLEPVSMLELAFTIEYAPDENALAPAVRGARDAGTTPAVEVRVVCRIRHTRRVSDAVTTYGLEFHRLSEAHELAILRHIHECTAAEEAPAAAAPMV